MIVPIIQGARTAARRRCSVKFWEARNFSFLIEVAELFSALLVLLTTPMSASDQRSDGEAI